MADLRPAVIEQGRDGLLLDRARDNAKAIIGDRLITALGESLRAGVEVDVELR